MIDVETDLGVQSIGLVVPSLVTKPFIGDGCCSVMAAEDVISEQFSE